MLASIIATLAAFIILCHIFLSPLLAERAGEKTNFFTALFKETPNISHSLALDYDENHTRLYLGSDFTLECKDDYKEVTILIELINRDGAVYKQDYITFKDCNEGKKYSKTYTLTDEEILKTDGLHYELYKYK